MRQISLLPAGCHMCDQTIVHASETKIIFSSKLALYVLNPHTFTVEKIISTQTRSLQSMSVNPSNDDYIACSGADGMICVWNVATEQCTRRFAHAADILAWDSHNPKNCAIIVNRPKIQVYLWDLAAEVCSTKRLFVADSDTVVANVARWNPHILGYLAVGCSNGVVYVYNTEEKSQTTLKVKDRATSVIDLQWDRLSAVYMLVAYQSFLSLWDTESGTEVHVFERQSTGISCLAWMDWTAGNFISANSKTGVVKVWNASQKQPLDSIRVHTAGITCVHFALGSSRLLCGAVDGSVVVYHMLRRQVEYSTCAGHTDTIFDCRLSPSSPDVLGTCSYDSTVKIWNMSDLTLKKTLYGPQCIIYSCSWSPNSSMMAASTISGRVIVWDVVSGKELVQYHHHKKASYCIDWNILMPDVLLTTSADGTAVVIKIDPEAVKESPLSGTGAIGSRRRKNTTAKDIAVPISTTRYEHPGPVYGGYWSPNVEDIFATACQDSLVRVFRYRGVLAPLFQLQGHSARAFNVSWSSLLPGLLASGSDDHLVMIWEVPRLLELSTTGDLPPSNTVLQPVKRLVGHTSNVRALSWNHEHRQVLISGSWDSTIRVWNAATGVCLQIISDHVADVYTVASHPRRPFTYVSCSRDSTLRVWELEGFVVRARLRAISDGYLEGILRSTEDVEAERGLPVGTILGSLPSAIEAVLGGEGSRALTRQFRCAASAGPAMFGDRKRIANGEELAVMYKALYE